MASQQTETTGSKTRNFIWTDDETALLLRIVLDYKSKKLADTLELETVRSKYENITERFIEAYPHEENSEEFSRKNSLIFYPYQFGPDPGAHTGAKWIGPKRARLFYPYQSGTDSRPRLERKEVFSCARKAYPYQFGKEPKRIRSCVHGVLKCNTKLS